MEREEIWQIKGKRGRNKEEGCEMKENENLNRRQ
jgi:hypothetical protein